MKPEKVQHIKKEATSSRHELGVAQQTATAVRESIEPSSSELLEEVLARENLLKALKRVQAKKGAAGIDGMTVDELPDYLRQHWPSIREQLLSASYKPAPVREVPLAKPGGGIRLLGIPTVLDRFIAQACLQVMSPIYDPNFSDHSYGFRPKRSALQAVEQARSYVEQGYRYVVDLDLEKFFDTVNQDMLMSQLAKRIKDKRLLKLIRAYLESGVMKDGLISMREAGMAQGSPLSPLLSNILLDELDKELERRGHKFCRYADDVNVYVKSQRAGERVMASLTIFLEGKLRLKVNRSKSAVARPWKRSFLGYTVTMERVPRLKPAPNSIKRAKDRLRQITQQGRGRNIRQVIQELNRYSRGWVSYFKLSTVKHSFELLDGWLRRRLRKILWEQWKQPKTRLKKLIVLGVNPQRAKKATATGLGAWWNAGASHMHLAVNNRLLKEWGLLGLLEQLRARQSFT